MGLIARLFNLRPSEIGPVAYLWLLHLLFSAATQLGTGVNQALFLKRIGVEYLPAMFVVKAGLDLVVAVIYVPVAARLGNTATLKLILLAAAGGMIVLWGPAANGLLFCYPLLYAFVELISTALKIHWGVLLLDCYDQRSAPRTFPPIYTGARLGAFCGGVVLGTLAHPLGAPHLVPIAGGFFTAALVLALFVDRHTRPGPDPAGQGLAREAAAGRIVYIRQGLSLGLRLPLLRAIAVATAVMVLCRYGLYYLHSEMFAASFDEASLASFVGIYMVLANIFSILMQMLVTSRMVVRAGVTATNLAYAVCVLAAYLAFGLWPSVAAAVVARLVDQELKAAVKTPLSNLFYGALEPAQRAPGRAFNLGLVVPLFTVVASALLASSLAVRWIPWWGGVLSVLFVLASQLQNRAYSRAADPAAGTT